MAEAGDVPARPGQARDQAALLGIGNGDEHHRYRRGRLLEGLRELVGADHDDIHILPDQVPRCAQHFLALAHGAARDEDVVLPLDVPELAKPVPQREQHVRTGLAAAAGRHAWDEESDPPHLPPCCTSALSGEARRLNTSRETSTLALMRPLPWPSGSS
jgi:hypothetical protein